MTTQTQILPVCSWAIGKVTLQHTGKASPVFLAITSTVPPHTTAGVGQLLLALAQRQGFAFLLFYTSMRDENQSPRVFAFPLKSWTGTIERDLCWKIIVERKKTPQTQPLQNQGWVRERILQDTDRWSSSSSSEGCLVCGSRCCTKGQKCHILPSFTRVSRKDGFSQKTVIFI